LSRILQNTQYLDKIERSNSNSKKWTQNLEELGFSNLPQTNRWKRRFYPEDPKSGVRFEFESFNLLKPRVLSQNPRREKRVRKRERERERERNELKRAHWCFKMRPVWTCKWPIRTHVREIRHKLFGRFIQTHVNIGTYGKSYPHTVRTW
jgi:hypothetical protein